MLNLYKAVFGPAYEQWTYLVGAKDESEATVVAKKHFNDKENIVVEEFFIYKISDCRVEVGPARVLD